MGTTDALRELVSAIDALLQCNARDDACWDKLESLLEPVGFSRLRDTPQNPAFHGEGDAMTHTRLSCRELCALDGFHLLEHEERTTLLLAAVLHVGKPETTRMEDGRWRSPNHSIVDSKMVREFLWRECGMCGTTQQQRLREAVCALIRHHMQPSRLMERNDPTLQARLIATIGELAPSFTWETLCLLGEADIRGRIAPNVEELVSQVELCRLLSEEAESLLGPYPFLDLHTRRAYLAGRNVQPDQRLYDDTWGEVVIMCGLPGTGKDTWAERHHPELPMVSLDGIRKVLGVGPRTRRAGSCRWRGSVLGSICALVSRLCGTPTRRRARASGWCRFARATTPASASCTSRPVGRSSSSAMTAGQPRCLAA